MQEVQLYIEGERIELFKDETISLTDSIKNAKDISKIFTTFSQEFNLPASPATNKLFKHYYNYDIVDGFDARYKATALIKLNGADYKHGKIRLNSVTLKNNKAHSYKVVFFGNTVTLTDVFGNDELDTLDLSAYDHTYSSAVVKAGLTTGLSTGGTTSTNRDVVYPFISHTEQFVVDDTPTAGSFHNFGGTNGLAHTDLKPAIKLKHFITAIESKYPEIDFSDDYFNSAEFLEMYMWLHREKGAVVSGNSVQNWVLDESQWTLDSGTNVLPITWQDEDNYTFHWVVTPVNGAGFYTVKVDDYRGSGNIYTSTNNSGRTVFTFTIENEYNPKPYWLNFTIETSGGLSTFSSDLSISKAFEGVTGIYSSPLSTESTAGNIVISEQVPKIKIIDFLSNLFKMSNLTAYLENDIIIVKTLDDYYSTGINHDVTKYIDVTNSDVGRALPYNEISLKYPTPKTLLINKANEKSNFEFGNLDYKAGVNFDGSKYNVKIDFERMMFERQSNQDTKVLTQLQWGWFVDKDSKPIISRPLIFYNINRPCNTNNIKWFDDTLINTTYNAASNVMQDNTHTLNFGAETDEYTGVLNTNSLFNEYYNNYIQSIFDVRARIFNFTANLPLSLLLKYNLNDKFIIAQKAYKINSINTDLQTGKSKLELITSLAEIPISATTITSAVEASQLYGASIISANLTQFDSVNLNASLRGGSVIYAVISSLAEQKIDVWVVAFSDEDTAITTGTNKVEFQMPNYATTLEGVSCSFKTAPTTSAITIDLSEGGTSVLSTKITVDATEKTSETAATASVISDNSLAANAVMTLDVDSADSGGTSSGGKLMIYFRKA